LEPRKDIEYGISHGDTIKSLSGLVLGAEGSIPSRHRSVSQPAQSLITELTTHDEDMDNQDEDDDDSDASRESQGVMALRRKLRHIQKQFGEPHDETFGVMVLLAMELKKEKYGRAGRLEAEQLLTPALGFYRAELGTTHPKTRSTMRLLADVWFELGKIRQASKLRAELSEPQKRAPVVEDTREKGLFLQDNVAHHHGKVSVNGDAEAIITDETKRDGFWQVQRLRNSSGELVPGYIGKSGVVSDPVTFRINADRPTEEQKNGIVLYNFNSQADDEVSVVVGGEVIIIDDTKSENWWQVRRIKNGKQGMVPSCYVEISGGVSKPGTPRTNTFSSTAEQNRLEEPRPSRTLTASELT